MLDSIDWGFALVVLGLPLCLWYVCGYRNHLVYEYRNKVLNLPDGCRKWDELPSYIRMVFSPVEWSARKLKRGPVSEEL